MYMEHIIRNVNFFELKDIVNNCDEVIILDVKLNHKHPFKISYYKNISYDTLLYTPLIINGIDSNDKFFMIDTSKHTHKKYNTINKILALEKQPKIKLVTRIYNQSDDYTTYQLLWDHDQGFCGKVIEIN